MALHNPVYYFTDNKMDILLRHLTRDDPQTPEWEEALGQLHQHIRAEQGQECPQITLMHKPFIALARPRPAAMRASLLLDRSVLASLPSKDKPSAKTVQDLQKNSFLTQYYQLKTDDVTFDIRRLVMLRSDHGVKRLSALPVYALEPHVRPTQNQTERLVRFMRTHSPTPESHPSLTHFGQSDKGLLHYYVMQMK